MDNSALTIEQLRAAILSATKQGDIFSESFNAETCFVSMTFEGKTATGHKFKHSLTLNCEEKEVKDFLNSYGAKLSARKHLMQDELSKLTDKSHLNRMIRKDVGIDKGEK